MSRDYDGAGPLLEVPSGGSSFVNEESGHLFWRFLQNLPAAYVTAKPLFAFFSPDCEDPLKRRPVLNSHRRIKGRSPISLE